MDTQATIEQTAKHVKVLLSGEASGHDWWHVYRVWNTAVQIGKEEGVDLFVVQLAALLHDVADWKFQGSDETKSARAVEIWLRSLHLEDSVITHVGQIIGDLSYKGAGVPTPMRSREGMVVQDADRLDALGAIGIARTFAYGGYSGQAMYDPERGPIVHKSFQEYKAGSSTTINHFFEKLLLLKERMNTEAGKALAEHRHSFMVAYLERFFRECEGKA